MAKALVRNITRRQALSYKRTSPNPIGVTSIAAVNGRGAASRNRSSAKANRTAARRRAEFRDMVANLGKATPNRRGRRAPGYSRRYAATKNALRARPNRDTSGRIYGAPVIDIGDGRKAVAAERIQGIPIIAVEGSRRKAKPLKKPKAQKAKGKDMAKAKAKAKKSKGRKKGKLKGAALAKWRRQHPAMVAQQKKAKAKAKGGKKAKKSRAKPTGKRRATKRTRRSTKGLIAKLGGRSLRTYVEKTPSGGLRKMPRWKVLGFRSLAAMKKAMNLGPGAKPGAVKTRDRTLRRIESIRKVRARRAERILRHGDIFTPNTTVIPYEEWSASMTPNKKRAKKKAKKSTRKGGKKRQTKKQRAASLKNLRKARAARKGGKKSGGKKRKSGGKKRRKSVAKKAKARKASGKKRRKSQTKKQRAASLRNLRKARAARKGGGGKKSRKSGGGKKRKSRKGKKGYRKNGRHFTKNAFLASLKEGLKVGAVVVVGFLGHKALTKVVDEMLFAKIAVLNSASMRPYRGLISGAATALVLVPVAGMLFAKMGKPDMARGVGAGVVTSFLHNAIVTALTQANQPKVAGYFAGMGEYFPMSGYELQPGGSGPISQAVAGYMQAAAGFGQPVLQAAAGYQQAAAGMGEYRATNVQAVGEYFPMSGMETPSGYVSDGIRGGDLYAAERALNVAEAQAGVGDIPTEQDVIPEIQSSPVREMTFASDIPGGNNGVFNPMALWNAPAASASGPEPTGSGVLFGEDGIYG